MTRTALPEASLAGYFNTSVSASRRVARKPVGVPATISGKLGPGKDGQIEARDLNYQAKKARVQIEL